MAPKGAYLAHHSIFHAAKAVTKQVDKLMKVFLLESHIGAYLAQDSVLHAARSVTKQVDTRMKVFLVKLLKAHV
jgi:hypothetical protein